MPVLVSNVIRRGFPGAGSAFVEVLQAQPNGFQQGTRLIQGFRLPVFVPVLQKPLALFNYRPQFTVLQLA
jgi:hypothetical protein